MTEDEAQQWLTANFEVSRETSARLSCFADRVQVEARHQNLIAASTVAAIWARHIVDSAQLLLLTGRGTPANPTIDLGSGAGFPGIVMAILSPHPIILVEARRKRHEFLSALITDLGLGHARVHGGSLESLTGVSASVITARAFAPLPRLFDAAHRFSRKKTVWLLPKGQSAAQELASTRDTWHGVFHVEPSVTDPAASIIVARAVQKRI